MTGNSKQKFKADIRVDARATEEVNVEVTITAYAGVGDSATITLTSEHQENGVSDSDFMVVTLIGEPELKTKGAREITDISTALKENSRTWEAPIQSKPGSSGETAMMV